MRGFLGGILAACAAPAIVKAELLMPVRKIVVPEFQDITTTLGEYVNRPRLTYANPLYTCFVPVDIYAEILKQEGTTPAKLYADGVGAIRHGIRIVKSDLLLPA